MGERKKRHLTLDVFDYQENKVCTLYDSEMEVSGQAADIYVNTQRNGWKELKFMIPSTLHTDSGEERNFRLDWLKAEYRIRMCDGTMQQDFSEATKSDWPDDHWQVDTTRPTEDWFLISEPKVQHKAFSQDYTVTAGHLCQLLKTRNLGLEFTDDEGNNVGRADEIADTILAGTGWELGYVHNFMEKRDPGKDKIRSIEAAAKTGAFKLLADMCEKFEAKPVYYTIRDTDNKLHRMVDILPMNPFEDEEQLLKNTGLVDNIIEMHYGKNVGGITRTLNTENMVTKLFAYGAYGDKTNGYCGIDEQMHYEYTLVPQSGTPAVGRECKFTIGSDVYYFRCNNADATSYVWSDLDPASKSYVSYVPVVDNEPDYDNIVVCEVYDQQKDSSDPFIFNASDPEERQNWVSYLMDYNYYREVGLMTDDQLISLAKYQRRIPDLLEDVYNKADTFNEKYNELSELIGAENFCRIATTQQSFANDEGYLEITLDKTVNDTGLVYRSDYTAKDKKRFRWAEADSLKPNGDAVNTGASVVYIIYEHTSTQQGDTTLWEKTYVKKIDNKEDPSKITLWLNYGKLSNDILTANSTRIYLFQSNNINGSLGALEIADAAIAESINSTTKVETIPHPVYYTSDLNGVTSDMFTEYAWLWLYDPNNYNVPSDLYYVDKNNDSDNSWKLVTVGRGKPENTGTTVYYFDYAFNVLYKKINGVYTALNEEVGDKRIGSLFASVYRSGQLRDKYYKGVYQTYLYDSDGNTIKAGNYAINVGYGTYYLYTVKEDISGDKLSFDTTTSWITPSMQPDNVIDTKVYGFNALKYHPSDILENAAWETGGINDNGGDNNTVTDHSRTSHIACYGKTTYYAALPEDHDITSINVYLFNSRRRLIGDKISVNCDNDDRTFVLCDTSENVRYMRIDINSTNETVRNKIAVYATSYENYVIANNEPYLIVNWTQDEDSKKKGIFNYMNTLLTLPDDTYNVACKEMVAAQKLVTEEDNRLMAALGDIMKEGYWQKDDYVDGDEDVLYADAVENIEKVSKPEATYNVDFTDLWGHRDESIENGITDDTTTTSWPDISIRSAAHLVDPEIDTNCWAFFDTINKCYDKPEKTKVAINTNLNVINQHSFTDVLSNIAQVASSVRGKTKIYERAKSIGQNGMLPTERLEGKIATNKLSIEGAASTTYTDERGNLVFESGDGTKAMTLTGAGFAIANSKNDSGNWDWRTFGTGDGFTADELVAGYISADLIEANTITADKLSSNVGESLNLTSNKSVNIMFDDIENEIDGKIDGKIKDYKQAFQFTEGGLEITAGTPAETSPFSTLITNQKLSFREGGNDVAYIDTSTLYISQSQMQKSMMIGKLQASIQDGNDNGIKWAWT